MTILDITIILLIRKIGLVKNRTKGILYTFAFELNEVSPPTEFTKFNSIGSSVQT